MLSIYTAAKGTAMAMGRIQSVRAPEAKGRLMAELTGAMRWRETDGPEIIAPPLVINASCFLIGLILEALAPIALLPNGIQYTLGCALIAASSAIVVMAFRRFRKAGTRFDARKPATVLVTDGLYRWSRNPGYLGMGLLYAGLGIVLDSVWLLASLAPALLTLHYGVILREERHLTAKFGENYARYRRSVRRWL